MVAYPDGSFEVYEDRLSAEQEVRFKQFLSVTLSALLAKQKSEGREDAAGCDAHFRGLWGEPVRCYILDYPDALQRGLGEDRLLILPNDWTEFGDGERRECLEVGLVMRRMPDDGCRGHIARLVGGWFCAVAETGVLGEGPVRPLEEHIEWRGRVGRFWADFSKSAQSTLNWLILWLVNHTDRYPIEQIILGHPEITSHFEARNRKPVSERLVFEAMREGCLEEVDLGGVGTDEEFEFVCGSDFQPELCRIQIKFCEPAGAPVRKQIEQAIRSWLVVGTHGGWGGHIAYYAKLKWNADKDVVWVDVDFGMSDVEAGLGILKRVLGNISRAVHRIDAVELKNP